MLTISSVFYLRDYLYLLFLGFNVVFYVVRQDIIFYKYCNTNKQGIKLVSFKLFFEYMNKTNKTQWSWSPHCIEVEKY